jgi:DNA invertase Pin-like site-specific DNA recombinase
MQPKLKRVFPPLTIIMPILSLPLSLVALADAIASAPRSPFFDDLAIARAAWAYVEFERAIRNAPAALAAEAAAAAGDAIARGRRDPSQALPDRV